MLKIRELKKYFPVKAGLGKGKEHVKALDGVSLEIQAGETFGLVGESGCGKSTLGYCVLRLIEPTAGEIFFQERNILTLDRGEMRRLRREIQMIFQDPASSLDPRMTVQQIVEEPFVIHRLHAKRERLEKVEELLKAVGMDVSATDKFPHQFSGGQRQRIGIARALALNPKLIVADEPVSALDVSIQAQIVNLMQELQARYGLTYLFISHGLPVVEHISDRIGVMYLGKLVETGTSAEVCRHPLHPYTQILLSSVPSPDPEQRPERQILAGEAPSPVNPPGGCRFHTRCPHAMERCKVEEPQEIRVSATHRVWCHLVEEASEGSAQIV
ncbi:MAG: ATP-binding cassette domain-containing protein [Acidobacteria bacterium]|nr:ATP-binding cassette domain-containing protein [Acidobacteriota bacterium]MCI0723310.1 ATP-binding cassette domain-containing protein [Acidobacteriota bacterium]